MRYALAIFALLTLAACNDYTDPVVQCSVVGKEYACRGGPCHECLQYTVGCYKPLVLDQDDATKKLICRLDKK